VPSEGTLAGALRPQDGNDDTALVLDIRDVPPMATAPSLGRIWVSGWAAKLDGDDARAAALDYADTDACGDLLDIGESQALYRMEVAEVRWERTEKLVEIDPDDYAEATPDPLRAVEFDLIADLADHHMSEMSDYVRRQLGSAARPGDEPKWNGPYLQKQVPLDPWGRAYMYRSPGQGGDFDLSSNGNDGQPGGDGDGADVSYR
jgi:type II secretory pathway pseudopilin PulG